MYIYIYIYMHVYTLNHNLPHALYLYMLFKHEQIRWRKNGKPQPTKYWASIRPEDLMQGDARCLYACMYMCMHVCIHVFVQINTYVRTYVHTHIYIHLHAYKCTRTYIHAASNSGKRLSSMYCASKQSCCPKEARSCTLPSCRDVL